MDRAKLFELLGFEPKKMDFYDLAFVHASFANEQNGDNNERLEFLGDAVLELVVTEYLYLHFPEHPEGQLTALRSALVRRESLANLGKKWGLGNHLLLSRGEKSSGGQKKDYILANAVEAFLGAVFLDKGLGTAKKVITKFLLHDVEKILEASLHIGPKSRFQEYVQKHFGKTPHYVFVEHHGPDHARNFTMAAMIGEEKIAEGSGSSKQKAEHAAAENAMNAILKTESY